ncbi:hypothetical protein NQ318_023036 [Aromia moschata]|uniref:Transcriptional coactivator p15 (PC4) C-terminal domain-containing protein n=1 Tax=Aromia moschata TaxID=1265417 RepID=A0AAV8XX76_9CUCU|nr:hypothetical protein NQ318_023036 [Aromia moschata]
MPKHKQKDESSSDSDSGPDDRAPVKKSKSETKQETSKSGGGDETSWILSKNRSARLTEFKGKWYVDIREFYTTNDGDNRPGRKGIMLTMEQWQKLKSHIDSIDDAIKRHV